MTQLEPMDAFFNTRVETYEDHMLHVVDGAGLYYRETAALFPAQGALRLLDLGCGTGLELDELWKRNPDIQVVGIDLAEKMLQKLHEKHASRNLTTVQADYFQYDFGTAQFDAAVSVESLHHFTHEEKLGLYRRLFAALKPGGFYVETDYYAPDQAQEDFYFSERDRLMQEQQIKGFFHFDTPCTIDNQYRLLREAGFSSVSLHWQQKGTGILFCQRS